MIDLITVLEFLEEAPEAEVALIQEAVNLKHTPQAEELRAAFNELYQKAQTL